MQRFISRALPTPTLISTYGLCGDRGDGCARASVRNQRWSEIDQRESDAWEVRLADFMDQLDKSRSE